MQVWVCKYTDMQAQKNPQSSEDRIENLTGFSESSFLKLDFWDFLKFNHHIMQYLLTLLSLVKKEQSHLHGSSLLVKTVYTFISFSNTF